MTWLPSGSPWQRPSRWPTRSADWSHQLVAGDHRPDQPPGLPDPDRYEVRYTDGGYQAADDLTRTVMRALDPAIALRGTIHWPGGQGHFLPFDHHLRAGAPLVGPQFDTADFADLYVSDGPWALPWEDSPGVVAVAAPDPDWPDALARLRATVLHSARVARRL